MERIRKKWKTAVCAGLVLVFAGVFPSYGEEKCGPVTESGRWLERPQYAAGANRGNDTGQENVWYYLAKDGSAVTGWVYTGGHWYFLNTAEGEEKGSMMTGWQWIGGKCYYLAETAVPDHPQGAMYAGEKTPDGYEVGASGAWLVDGLEIYVPGKGIVLDGADAVTGTGAVKTRSVSSTKKGGGSSGGGNKTDDSSVSEESKNDSLESRDESVTGGEETGDLLGEENKGSHSEGGEEKGSEEGIEKESEKETEKETEKEMEKESDETEKTEDKEPATPSSARKVIWEVSFVDEADPNRKIFRKQRGENLEGTELYVDFPEKIEGSDGWKYQALERSPKRITVAGTGVQKYVVLFRREEQTGEEPEINETEQRLAVWIQRAKEADLKITGEMAKDWQVITKNQKESCERLLNLVSMVSDGARHEIYLIAKNHTPSALVIVQEFVDTAGISELQVDELSCSGDCYRIIRVGFQRTWNEKNCVHDMELRETIASNCSLDGYERYRCRRCSHEETVFFPATGHLDEDGDGICDICCMDTNDKEEEENVLYREGDIQVRYIGGKPYRFRCIDEDYSDDKDNRKYAALFLCESVIRSDADNRSGTFEKLNFGSDNNYKTSNVRKWLKEKTEAACEDISVVSTGVSTAYLGATEKGEYEQFAFDELKECEKPFQMMEDKMFLFSVEEAVKYRDFLWKFNGSSHNNPQSQYSPYSRGYYLRTPQYEGGVHFQYGAGIYIVDLDNGSIHPADVSDTSIGIRPAYILSQNREL